MGDINFDAHKALVSITEEEWGRILPRLRLYAALVVRRKHWRSPTGMLPGGFEDAELANEAIKRVLTGQRRWDPAQEPDLLVVLKGVVKSLASDLVRSADHTRGTRFGRPDEDLGVAATPHPAPDPEQVLENKDLLRWVWAELEDDEEQEILLYLEEGFKPAEIAKESGRPIERVYLLLRKMRRRLESARLEQESKEEGGPR